MALPYKINTLINSESTESTSSILIYTSSVIPYTGSSLIISYDLISAVTGSTNTNILLNVIPTITPQVLSSPLITTPLLNTSSYTFHQDVSSYPISESYQYILQYDMSGSLFSTVGTPINTLNITASYLTNQENLITKETLNEITQSFITLLTGSTQIPNDITVELGTSFSGDYDTGEVVIADTPIIEVITNMLRRRIHPVYVAPTITLTSNIATSNNVIEVLTTSSITLYNSFTQNDAGTIYNYEYDKQNILLTTSSLSYYTDIIYPQYTTIIQYKSIVYYNKGNIKKNNLGEDDAVGQILQGNIASTVNIIPNYRTFVGYNIGIEDDCHIIFTDISNLTVTAGTLTAISSILIYNYVNSYTLNIPNNTRHIYIAYPFNSNNFIDRIIQGTLMSNITAIFNISTVYYNNIPYILYDYYTANTTGFNKDTITFYF